MEQLFDAFASTLYAGYTAGSGSLVVTSSTGLPSTGTFTVTVLDQTTKAIKNILKCTARSGTTLTVTAEGSDVNCSSGDIVIGGMLSKRSITQILTDWLGYGAYSSLPASGLYAGQRYKCSDGPYELIWTGSVWAAFIAGDKVAVPLASFGSAVWANQQSATVQATNGAILLQETGSVTSAGSIRCYLVTVPSAPYKIWTRLTWSPDRVDGSNLGGICLTNGMSSGAAARLWNLKTNGQSTIYGVSSISSPSFSTIYDPSSVIAGVAVGCSDVWIGIEDDGTNRHYVSCVGGRYSVPIYSEGNTAGITPTYIGIYIRPNDSTDNVNLELTSWLQQ